MGGIELKVFAYPVVEDRWNQIYRSPYRGTQAIIVCYDCTNTLSLCNSLKWMKEIQRYATEEIWEQHRIVLVETKNETNQRVIPEDIGKFLSKMLAVPFVSTSSAQAYHNMAPRSTQEEKEALL
uniref:Uncharacterized protein n=1 Tax=Arcella intermedia TaxID=1963864 RepID=A0A6B2LS92_9EUKA